MADLVSTLTGHAKLVAVAVGAVALFGGTATTVSLVDQSSPSPSGPPSTKPAPQANPHAAAPKAAKTEDADDAAEKDSGDDADKGDKAGVRPTDTHGYCVSRAVAAAKAKGATGRDIPAAAHSCKPAASQGKSATARGHNKG